MINYIHHGSPCPDSNVMVHDMKGNLIPFSRHRMSFQDSMLQSPGILPAGRYVVTIDFGFSFEMFFEVHSQLAKDADTYAYLFQN